MHSNISTSYSAVQLTYTTIGLKAKIYAYRNIHIFDRNLAWFVFQIKILNCQTEYKLFTNVYTCVLASTESL